ncbi:MAG: PAS domain S-box protein [Magnetococcus sp. YQC-9]
MHDSFAFRNRLLLPLAAGFFFTILTFAGSLVGLHIHQTDENLDNLQQELGKMFTARQSDILQEIAVSANLLTRVESLQTAFRSQDRQELLQAALPLFTYMRDHNNITHLYFHSPSMETFLRVHQPERYGDLIQRTVNHRALTSLQQAEGLELGPLGTLTLRVVVPWRDTNDQLLGFIELGKEFGHLLQGMMHHEMVTQLHLFLNKSLLKHQDWQQGARMMGLPTSAWEQFEYWVWSGGTSSNLPSDVDPKRSSGRSVGTANRGTAHFNTLRHPLLWVPVSDVAGREAGQILAIIDTSELVKIANFHLAVIIPGLLLLAILLIRFYATTLGRIERQMNDQGVRLLEKTREHQANETAMRILERQHRSMLESVGEGIFGVDREGRATFVNPAALANFGFASSELLGTFHHALIHHTYPDGSFYPVEQCPTYTAIHYGAVRHVKDEWFWRRDGTSFPVEYTATPIIDDNEILGAVVVFRDISERQESERRIEQNLAFLKAINRIHAASFEPLSLIEQLEKALEAVLTIPWLFVQFKGAIFLTDPDMPEVLKLMVHCGISKELVQQCTQVVFGHCLCGRVAQEQRILHVPCVDHRHENRCEGMMPHGHYVMPLLSKKRLLGVVTLYLEHDHPYSSDEAEMIIGLGNSIAVMIERWQAQELLYQTNILLEQRVQERTQELEQYLQELRIFQDQLVRSERMAALGGLVAGISHEINTPIGIGYTASTHLLAQIVTLEERYQNETLRHEDLTRFLKNAREALDLIIANLNRANELIASFKNVAVDQTSQELRRIRVKEYLNQIVMSLRPRLRQGSHRVAIDAPNDLEWTTWPGSLSQILSNLIINSLVHAFAPSFPGIMTIRVFREEAVVRLEYRDNGRGLSPEIEKRIFEPFFTTRRGEGCCGLGMHVVYNVVTQKMGGTIQCGQRENHGAYFLMSFPCAEFSAGDPQ